MKTTLTLLTMALGASACLLSAQINSQDSDGQRSPPRAGGAAPRTAEVLSDAQKQQVKAILSGYDPATLTADQAKAIHQAFRQAGLRGGPAMADTIKAAGFDPNKLRDLAPPPGRNREEGPPGPRSEGDRAPGGEGGPQPPAQASRGQGQYSTEQAVSDRAQLNTLAFDGLAFLTGDLGSCTFLPPGKAADFFGFQYMRDVDANQLGHNTSFVPRAANNVLHILADAQKAQLIALGKEQEKLLADLAYKRFPLIKAFCRELVGDLPAGTAGLKREAVMQYTAAIFEIDGRLSYQRARVLGGIIRSLTESQKAYLGKMVFNNSATWPELPDQVDKRSLPHAVHVAVMTYASEMYSWYAGSEEADVYFCPERHATYFGSFYMKDIPAMGNANFSISTSLTGDSGEAFLAALTDSQRSLVTSLVDLQRKDLQEIVAVRRSISTELRRFMKQESVDQDKVLALARRYGELDGEISYWYATRFAQVGQTLTAAQKQTLLKLRNLDSKFTCKGAYLYSQPIAMPVIPNTDFLFGTSTEPTARPTSTCASAGNPSTAGNTFELRSPAFANGGRLPIEYTGDGAAATPPLEWSTPPAGTRTYALIMHHVDPEGKTKWYWTLYNIPAEVRSLASNTQGIGMLGNNSVNGSVGYAPPHSRGPGAKTYVLTLYALSSTLDPSVPAAEVNRDILLGAMKAQVLASAELQVVYARPASFPGQAEEPQPRVPSTSSAGDPGQGNHMRQ